MLNLKVVFVLIPLVVNVAKADVSDGDCYRYFCENPTETPCRYMDPTMKYKAKTFEPNYECVLNSPKNCLNFCHKHYDSKWVGTSGYNCFCGSLTSFSSKGEHHLEKFTEKAESTECFSDCPGDAKQKCGGTYPYRVYNTISVYNYKPEGQGTSTKYFPGEADIMYLCFFPNTGCSIWIWDIFCGFVFGAKHFPYHFYSGKMCSF